MAVPARAVEPTESQQKLIDLRYRLLETQARLEIAEKIAGEAIPKEEAHPDFIDNPQIQNDLKTAFGKSHDDCRRLLDVLEAKLKELHESTRQRWRVSTGDSLRFQEEVSKAQAHYQFDWRDNQPPGFALGWVGWTVAGSWVVMFVVCTALCAHELRLGLRRSRRIAGVFLVAGGLFPLAGCANPQARAAFTGLTSVDDEISQTSKKLEETNSSLQAAQMEARSKRDLVLRNWEAWLGKEAADAFRSEEEQAGKQVTDLLQTARLTEMLAKETRDNQAQLEADRKRLDELIDKSRSKNTQYRFLRVGGCIALAFLGFVPLFVVRRRLASRRREETRTCPRCLARGTLKTIRTQATDKHGKPIVFLECSKCRFRFPSSHQKLPRISFPTVGIKSSGKTQWLLLVLDQISNGQVPAPAALEVDMNQIAPQIKQLLTMLKRHVAPPPSVLSLPEPLSFVLRDADRWGPTQSLASLFDFAGKTMDEKIFDNEFRRRALRMNGFLLFLDPTQLEADPNEGTETLLDRQKEQVTNFYLDLCKELGVDDGACLNVPVAVCVTKFDLLVMPNCLGEQARPKIAELRKMKADRGVSMEMLRKRSNFCKSMLRAMFKGWEVDGALRKRFGSNIMYFPLSSVSLIDAELGEKDLKRRTLAPFGLVEPFLWLLHMQGFCIFEGGSR
jgi:hypothetical protein